MRILWNISPKLIKNEPFYNEVKQLAELNLLNPKKKEIKSEDVWFHLVITNDEEMIRYSQKRGWVTCTFKEKKAKADHHLPSFAEFPVLYLKLVTNQFKKEKVIKTTIEELDQAIELSWTNHSALDVLNALFQNGTYERLLYEKNGYTVLYETLCPFRGHEESKKMKKIN